MNWLDVVLICLLLLAAFTGWRSGAARQVLSLGGLWLGLFVGAIVAPPLARLTSGSARAIVAIVVVVVVAASFTALGEIVGYRAGRVLRRLHVGLLDEAVGVVVGVAGMLLAFWLLGNIVSVSQVPAVDRAVQGSKILRSVNSALPPLPSVFARIESFLSAEGFPIVFVNLPPQLVAPAPLPADPAVRAAATVAAPSTVKVIGPACSSLVEGSGFVVAPHLVVTNAHVVAGDQSPRVIDASGSHAATAILFDPHLDVAVLEVPTLSDPALKVDTAAVPRGTGAAVLGYPEGGGLKAVAASVNATFDATGLDIYGNTLVTREVHELHATILPGNSGGPLVSLGTSTGSPPRGTVIGLVFARSTTSSEIGYALAMGAVEADVHQAEQTRTPVSTGACAG